MNNSLDLNVQKCKIQKSRKENLHFSNKGFDVLKFVSNGEVEDLKELKIQMNEIWKQFRRKVLKMWMNQQKKDYSKVQMN
jgi:hypothetical protein